MHMWGEKKKKAHMTAINPELSLYNQIDDAK